MELDFPSPVGEGRVRSNRFSAHKSYPVVRARHLRHLVFVQNADGAVDFEHRLVHLAHVADAVLAQGLL